MSTECTDVFERLGMHPITVQSWNIPLYDAAWIIGPVTKSGLTLHTKHILGYALPLYNPVLTGPGPLKFILSGDFISREPKE